MRSIHIYVGQKKSTIYDQDYTSCMLHLQDRGCVQDTRCGHNFASVEVCLVGRVGASKLDESAAHRSLTKELCIESAVHFSTCLRLQGDHYCACAQKWCHFLIFSRPFKQKKKKLRPKLTKIASRGSCLKKFSSKDRIFLVSVLLMRYMTDLISSRPMALYSDLYLYSNLFSNSITSLPADVFTGLTGLIEL